MLAALFVSGASAAETKIGSLVKANADDSAMKNSYMSLKDLTLGALFTPDFDITKSSMHGYESLTLMQLALAKGEVDAIVAPYIVGEYMLAANPEYAVKGLWIGKKPVVIALGFLEERAQLRDRFNEALEIINNSSIGNLLRENIFNYGEEPKPVKFEHFDGAETVSVAVTGDLPPIDCVAEDGNPAGFNTALLAEIGRILRINIKLVNVETGARVVALKSVRADVVFWFELPVNLKNLYNADDAPKGLVFSTPYFEWNKVYFIGRK